MLLISDDLQREVHSVYLAHLRGLFEEHALPGLDAAERWPTMHLALSSAVARHVRNVPSRDLRGIVLGPQDVCALGNPSDSIEVLAHRASVLVLGMLGFRTAASLAELQDPATTAPFSPAHHRSTCELEMRPLWSAIGLIVDSGPDGCHYYAAGPDDDHVLDLAEVAVAQGMTLGRRRSFVAGRIASGMALRLAGHTSPALTCDRDSVPLFPTGYVGSIAHKHGRAVAVVGRSVEYHGIGIDLERDSCDDEVALAGEVLTTPERELLTTLPLSAPGLVSAASLVLAIKEAAYKAIFPIGRQKFGFDDMEVAVDPSTRSFAVHDWPGRALERPEGRYALAEGWIVAVARIRRINVDNV